MSDTPTGHPASSLDPNVCPTSAPRDGFGGEIQGSQCPATFHPERSPLDPALPKRLHLTALSDEEHAEWVWWKERLITAPTTQKLANHVSGKVGTDRGRPMSWANIVGVMDKIERRYQQIQYSDPSMTDTDTVLEAPSRHRARYRKPTMGVQGCPSYKLGKARPVELSRSRTGLPAPGSSRTIHHPHLPLPDDREVTPDIAPPPVPTTAQDSLPLAARAIREPSQAPSLALTEETIMQEFPTHAGHINRIEHDIRIRHIRERLEGSIAELSARVADQEETIAELEALLRLENNGH
ncbi:uncharacterized protein FIESC28_00999 [Fusarium coffeatum]|uniref:Uncharacterized protein n=1 Tax=Fusarium coffeatum TaxID=231269 RepID=A0A366SC29_9HYPO|nr:uncharacterized protein FIESC28_00999 [Fusarium coffeatum]RBR26216.1 hypothetical protein FIESC28_00999 [Fusarium coffeatum]